MELDRNVLFGVLAVQLGRISPRTLAEVWEVGKDAALADQLQLRGLLTPAERTEIERLLDGQLKPSTNGGSATVALRPGKASPSATVASNPAEGGGTDGGSATLHTHIKIEPTLHPPEHRDRYSLTRLHAQGGIGQVWLAHDVDLERDVALKELRPDNVENPLLWTRFLEEARITGQLEHPGIVPVYELVQPNNGLKPFYAMRFVRGRTLAQAISEYHAHRKTGLAGPLELRELLGAFVAVCHTLAYAHSRQVVHRDLKPQNIMLGDFGEVLVLDWGLAKVLNRAEPEPTPVVAVRPTIGRDDTVLGQVLGTPSYMAPEQAEGRPDLVDTRTDVYGLGAILYDILTGEPPFLGQETMTLLQRVIHDPPVRPRQLVAECPPALEAVCLKALAKEPAQRYAAASELAHEVQCWLADEPVAVYPEPRWQQLRRWGRRHRTTVTAGAALLVMAVLVLSMGLLLLGRKNAEIRAQQHQTELARLEEAEQRQRAQANFARARDAVDKMLIRVGSDRLRQVPQMEKLRRELLEEAVEFNKAFVREAGTDPDVRHDAAEAYGRLGRVYHLLRQDDAAREAETQAIDRLTQLAAEFPDVPIYRRNLALSYARRAPLQKSGAAEADSQEALRLYEQLVTAYPAAPGYRQDLAEALLVQLQLDRNAARHQEAQAVGRRAVALFEQLTTEAPGRDDFQDGRARALHNLATLLDETGQKKEAESVIRSALAVRKELTARQPENPEQRDELAATLRMLGVLVARSGRPAEAEKLFEEALANWEKLATDFPAVPDYREHLATGNSDLGVLRAQAGRIVDAEPYFRRVLEIQTKLATDFPAVADYRRRLGMNLSHLSLLMHDLGKPAEAEKLIRQGVAVREKLADEFPNVPDYRWDLAVGYADLAARLQAQDRRTEAEAAYRTALAEGGKVAAALARLPDFHHKQALASLNLGMLLNQSERHAEAEPLLRRARDLWEKLARDLPRIEAYRRFLAMSQHALGELYRDTDRLQEAEQADLRALALQEKLIADAPKRPEYREQLADTQRSLALLCRTSGRFNEAEKYLRQALALQEQRAAESQAVPRYQAALARTWKELAALQLATDSRDAALSSLEKARALLEKLPASGRRDLYLLACVHALEAPLLARDKATAPRARQAEDAALAALQRAVAAGYADVEHLKTDADLAPLRNRGDFQKLVKDLEARTGQ